VTRTIAEAADVFRCVDCGTALTAASDIDTSPPEYVALGRFHCATCDRTWAIHAKRIPPKADA
jgi:hypothetical protein